MPKYLKIIIVVLIILFLVVGAKASTSMMRLSIKNVINKLPKSPSQEYEKRSLDQVDQVIVHHSATNSGTSESYARYHVDTRGWPGIGYHYVIAKDGSIEQTNKLDTLSFHTTGQNTRSIGICLTGNYDEQQAPQAQIDALVRLIKSLQRSLGRRLKVAGHNQYANKSCPGDNVDIDKIKNVI